MSFTLLDGWLKLNNCLGHWHNTSGGIYMDAILHLVVVAEDRVDAWCQSWDDEWTETVNTLIINLGTGEFKYSKCASLKESTMLLKAWHHLRVSLAFRSRIAGCHFEYVAMPFGNRAGEYHHVLKLIGTKGEVDNSLLKNDVSHMWEGVLP